MAKKLIVANWKMNPQTYKEAEDLISEILKGVRSTKTTIVLCPPFTWLTDFSHKNKSSTFFGAQDVFYREEGAFTGEISPKMLKSSKVNYVIVGHSERRELGETDEVINKKLRAALRVGLKPILCVGENENQEKSHVIETELREGLKGISSAKAKSSIIAYEPIWAIGTGKNCSVEEAMTSILIIKSTLNKLYSREVADRVKILYGGSVNPENASSYLEENFIDGLLIGGSSLSAKKFIGIVKSVQ